MKTDCYLGLDLGQRVDYTAMALVTPVVEADGPVDYLRWLQPTVERLRVVRLERLPLGTRTVVGLLCGPLVGIGVHLWALARAGRLTG